MSTVKLGIYKHYKGDFYKVTDIVYAHDDGTSCVVYHKCDENGVFKSIRKKGLEWEDYEFIVKQPFLRELEDFIAYVEDAEGYTVPRFQLIKDLSYGKE